MAADMKPEFRGHFDHLAAGKVAFPVCDDCHQRHWYPMAQCPHCQSSHLSWQPVRGIGEIWSWTIVRHAFGPEFRDRLPYIVALICFEDAPGIRLVANIEHASPDELRIGLPVEFIPPAGAAPLRPVFRPLQATEPSAP
jgi:uncharacterized OB-fold protein